MFKDDYEKVKNENIKKVCDYLASRDDVDKDKEGKSIDEMWKYIVGKAKERSVNGCAVLSDDEVYGLAVHYYDEDIVIEETIVPPKKEIKKKKPDKKEEQKVDSTWEQISLF